MLRIIVINTLHIDNNNMFIREKFSRLEIFCRNKNQLNTINACQHYQA